ncbi:MAG: inositol monophosphatase [Verrucomicrobia bacterium]|nr:inositol monophosphatase [Verrucomicrobiota bacterium]
MTSASATSPLAAAIAAARAAGELIRSNFGRPLNVAEMLAHDIKLDLDVQSQALITNMLLAEFPTHAIYGEEGIAGNQASDWQWIIDPIDGTVNFFYSLPHFCISIALRHKDAIQVGVIYDPMRDELWEVERGGTPKLNGNPIQVSQRKALSDAIVSVGMSKSPDVAVQATALLEKYVRRARKCRLMGSAALDLAYVACGRLDAYIEQSVSLWDVAAGQLLVEAAGGRFESVPRSDNPDKISIRAWNGSMDISVS